MDNPCRLVACPNRVGQSRVANGDVLHYIQHQRWVECPRKIELGVPLTSRREISLDPFAKRPPRLVRFSLQVAVATHARTLACSCPTGKS